MLEGENVSNQRDARVAIQGEREAQPSLRGDYPIVEVGYLSSHEWRCIGPHRGGRVVAVAGDPCDPLVFYFGATAGGVWKTYDAGRYWENVSDGFFNTAAVGAIAIAESDPNVVYVGTGESCLRHDISPGDGMYKSTDGGTTWMHVGLEDTRHIARVRVDPNDPDIVYVAALGHAFGYNEERGIYRTRDGGRTWELVLFKSEKAGGIDLSMDANNPRVLYAAIYQAIHRPWTMSSGGPDSGLYKSTDGGDTWVDLSGNYGLPQGIKGRISVAVSPAKSSRVWALIEAEDGGLVRSDDGGLTWESITDNADIRRRAWYFNHLYADTRDPETCYVLSFNAWKSSDGGRTFAEISIPHMDHHDLWIDPNNPERMIEGNDGGACITLNGGDTWSTLYNQPTASIFHATTDTQFPYRIYGTQMDNTAISVPSKSDEGAISWKDCYPVGSSESGYIAVRPDNPNVVYSGAIGSAPGGGGVMLRYDRHSGQTRIITVWPEDEAGSAPKDVRYRFHFTYPIILSTHDHNVLYVTSNVVFKSTDEGTSWEVISPDLTRYDLTKLSEISGGPITRETAGNADMYATIFAFAESPHEPGVLWAGSDDGLIHLSRDDGKNWENVTPNELPEWTLINMIEPSPHDPATVYVAATRYRLDDNCPMLYKTNDYGATWTDISNGIREHDYTRVIREDPSRRGMLYAGTETGVYVSFDDGASWQSLQINLPVVPIHDLVIKEGDLIAATHGRSFWVMDDLTPLYQVTEEVVQAPVHLFKPRPAYRALTSRAFSRPSLPGKNYQRVSGETVTYYETRKPNGEIRRVYLDAGENPPAGAVISYYLKQKPEGDVRLNFLDKDGEMISSFSSNVAVGRGPRVSAEPGMNRFAWDMRYPGPRGMSIQLWRTRPIALQAPPGSYQVELIVEGQSYIEPLEIKKDPRISATQEELDESFGLMVKIRDKYSETSDAIYQLRSVLKQVEDCERRAQGRSGSSAVTKAAIEVREKLLIIEDQLTRDHYPNDLKLPPTRLNGKLASLMYVVSSADWVPTKGSYDVFEDVSARIDRQIKQLQQVIDTDVAAFVRLLDDVDIPTIVPTSEAFRQ